MSARRWITWPLGRNLAGTPVRFCMTAADIEELSALREELGMPSAFNSDTGRWERRESTESGKRSPGKG